jgi:outer membrane protein TolC
VQRALATNPLVQAAQADAAEAEAVRREARAARLPALRAQGLYTRLGGDIPSAEIELPGFETPVNLLPIALTRYQAELALEQPIFAGGRLRNQSRAAAHEAAAAQWLVEQEQVEVAFEVRRAYWTLYGALAAQTATESALDQIDEHLREVTNRLDVGAALRSEVLTVQTRRSEIRLEQLEAENAVRIARLELNRLAGFTRDVEVLPVGPLEIESVVTPPSEDPGAGLEHPQISALAERVSALEAQLSVARGDRLPSIAGTGRYLYARPSPYAYTDVNQMKGTWEVGLVFTWNLWEGGAQSARMNQARERLRAGEARLADARDLIAVETERQYLEARRATEAVSVAEEGVATAEESYRVARQLFEEGVSLTADVLDAEQALRLAEVRRARALAEYGISRAALLRALGRIR